MKRNSAYLPVQAVFPLLGLNTLQPESQANPQYSPSLRNFTIVKGVPTKRLGMYEIADSTDINEDVIGLVEFETISGVKKLFAFTAQGSQFLLDQSSDPPTWTDKTSIGTWSSHNPEDTKFDFAVVSGLDNGGTFSKWLIVTNGTTDEMVVWTDSTTFKEWIGDLSMDYVSFVTARTVAMFFNRVIIANVKASREYKQLIGFSAEGELTDFTSVGSGLIEIPGISGEFVRMLPLGDRLILYSTDSLCVMTYVAGAAIFGIETVNSETRLVCGRAIANLGAYHVFLSQENVFLFDGNRLMRTMGDAIFRQYRNELDVDRASEAFAWHDAPRQQVSFVVPVKSGEHAVYVMDYDLVDIGNSKWTRYEYLLSAEIPRCAGTWSRESTLTFDSNFATITHANVATFSADQGSLKEGFPVRLLGFDDGRVFTIDGTTSLDDDKAVKSFWDTIDFTVPSEFLSNRARWIELQLEALGTSVDVYYSTDGGTNYTFVETVTLNGSFQLYTVPFDVVSERLRIRFVNDATDGLFSFRWYRLFLRAGGPA